MAGKPFGPATLLDHTLNTARRCRFGQLLVAIEAVIGLVLDLWPQSAQGYAPAAYTWALGMSWAVQLAGLAWLWQGRNLLAATRAA